MSAWVGMDRGRFGRGLGHPLFEPLDGPRNSPCPGLKASAFIFPPASRWRPDYSGCFLVSASRDVEDDFACRTSPGNSNSAIVLRADRLVGRASEKAMSIILDAWAARPRMCLVTPARITTITVVPILSPVSHQRQKKKTKKERRYGFIAPRAVKAIFSPWALTGSLGALLFPSASLCL